MTSENNDKQAKLKGIIKQLHAGVPVDKLKKSFADIIKQTSPEEIADMENALIQEGFPVEEVQRLCDVHAQVFEKSLKKAGKPGKIPGHPIYTFIEENKQARRILKDLNKAVKKLKTDNPKEKDIRIFKEHFTSLKEIEKHYQRKENQLFPMLEAKKFTGPTKVMWGKHDEIREMIKEVDGLIKSQKWGGLPNKMHSLSNAMKKLIFLEEKILYPTSAKKMNTREWAEIKLGEPEIGYSWVKPSNLWDAQLAKATQPIPAPNQTESTPQKQSAKIQLSQGLLTADQVDALLKHLPVDITFVDENDKVCYYSETKERIFPRSPAIIGRDVQNCHPQKSVHIVNDIIKNFREKKKDKAVFWIHMQGKFIYIRYFPVYDKEGTYKGVIEVTQEISEMTQLKGERRLLDW
ncbi:DUF438 domain-containing protein [candidate division KSB1 bacterium]|nr:DUF438 domain-containing protein [candidate division KSB1 bacterium]